MVYLTAINGYEVGRRYDLVKQESVLGRHPECDVVIDVGAVSRQHAIIHRRPDGFELEDLNSRNGTFLNGEQIHGMVRLGQGDIIRICDIEFAYHDDSKPQHLSGVTNVSDGSSFGVMLLSDEDAGEKPIAFQSKLDVRSTLQGTSFGSSSAEARLQAVLEIAQSLGRAVRLEDVIPKVLSTLFKLFVQADRAFVVLKVGDELVPKWFKTRRQEQEETFRISKTIVREVMETKQAIISLDASSDSRFDSSNSIADFQLRSIIVAPLLDSEGEALGVLQMDTLDAKRRFEQRDLEILIGVATQAGISIENAQLHDALLQQQRVEKDLELARSVQQAFLPAKGPGTDGYDFYHYYHPADQVGGDYFDYVQLFDGRIAIIVADVVGHGIAAALLMAKLSAETRFLLARQHTAAEAITKLNRHICRLGLDRFVTFLCLILDPATGRIDIVNAGHMAPLWLKSDGTMEQPGDETAGIPIGVVEDYEYEMSSIDFGIGDVLILYTDGINEAPDISGKMFGIDRLQKTVAKFEGHVFKAGESIIREVRDYIKGTQQADDMCLVMISRGETTVTVA